MLRECLGPVMDRQTGVYECPRRPLEPSEEDCECCQGAADSAADLATDARWELQASGGPQHRGGREHV